MFICAFLPFILQILEIQKITRLNPNLKIKTNLNFLVKFNQNSL